ncbi:MAG: hypothetical protein C4525_03620 [Desulfarculus sp.]|nr:MAG: hypothetical protein C4525_03620 [Desulfarculus sp.]
MRFTKPKRRGRWLATLGQAAFLLLLLALGAEVVFSGLAGRVLLSHDLGLVYHAAYNTVLGRLPARSSRADTLAALRDYLHLTVQPVGRQADLGPTRVLLGGQGWCDQISDIYLRLIEPLKVRGYLAFLQARQGPSPHTVALITPGLVDPQDWSYLSGHAVVVDLLHGVTYRRPGGGPAAPADICRGRYQPRLPQVRPEWFCRRPKIHLVNQPRGNWSAAQRWLWRAWRLTPAAWEAELIRLAVRSQHGLEPGQRAYLLARVEHILLRLEPAGQAYQAVERRYPDSRWAYLARHYRLSLPALAARFPGRAQAQPAPRRP